MRRSLIAPIALVAALQAVHAFSPSALVPIGSAALSSHRIRPSQQVSSHKLAIDRAAQHQKVGRLRGGVLGMSAKTSDDLLIVGAGYLGALLVEQYTEAFPEAQVIAETRSEAKHEKLKALGAEPRTIEEGKGSPKMPNVVFCASPSGNDDYPAQVKRALSMWSGEGRFVFTSSTGVYGGAADGIVVDETSPVDTSDKAKRLLDGEKAVLEAKGTVLRLAGLYSLERGAHNFWLKSPEVKGRPDGLIGLVSYYDAAGAAKQAIVSEGKVAGEVFLICDAQLQTRKDICESALKAAMYKDKTLPTFGPSEGPIGRKHNNKKALEVLGWKPKYASFDEYCTQHA